MADRKTINFSDWDITQEGLDIAEDTAATDRLLDSANTPGDLSADYESPWTELKNDFARETALGVPSQIATTGAAALAGGAALTNPVTAPFAVPIGATTGALVGGGVDYLANMFRPAGKENSVGESLLTGGLNLVGGKVGKGVSEGVSDALASAGKREADKVLANPRALTALETFEAKKGGAEEALDAFRAGKLTGQGLTGIKTTEAMQRSAGDTFEDRFAGALEKALIPRSDAGAKIGIGENLAEKVKPVAKDVLDSGILDARNVKELGERAAAIKQVAYKTVLDSVAGKEVSTSGFALTGQKLIALADRYKNMPEADDLFRGMVAKGQELIKKYGNPDYAFDFRPVGSAPRGPLVATMPAEEALEMKQVMNELERAMGKFSPENIAKAMTGSSIANSPDAIKANFKQMRGAIDGALEAVAEPGFKKGNDLYGAYDAIEKAAQLAETETNRSMKNASTRLISTPGEEGLGSNLIGGLARPTSRQTIGDVAAAGFRPQGAATDEALTALRAAEQPENIMTELRGSASMAQDPGGAIKPSGALEGYVNESRIRRAASPSEWFDPRNKVRSAIPQAAIGAGAQAGAVEGIDALTSADTASAQQGAKVIKQVQRDAQTKAQNVYRTMPGQSDPYPQGFPRELEGLDPEVFASRFLEKAGTDPMRSLVAKQLVDSFAMAHKQNDIAKREKVYEAMSTTFPEFFKVGWGVNGRIWDKGTQQGYLARIQRDADVDAQFLAQQKSAFNDRNNPKVLQIPVKKVTQADVQAQQRAGQKRVQLPDGSYDVRQ